MNSFDIVVITILSFCLIRGYFKGLIGEVSGMISVVAGFYGAYTYYPELIIYVKKVVSNEAVQNILAFFILFCAIIITIHWISVLIHKLLKFVFLGWVDRTFGVVFGAAKGLMITSVIFIMITNFLPNGSKMFKGSVSSPYIAEVSKVMTVFISKKPRKDFFKKIEGMF